MEAAGWWILRIIKVIHLHIWVTQLWWSGSAEVTIHMDGSHLIFWIKCCQLYDKYQIFMIALGPKTLFRPLTHDCGQGSGWWCSFETTDCVCAHHGSLVSPNNWRESTHAHTHTQTHTYPSRRSALCPSGCLLLGDKAGFYVRKRLMPEPGVLGEPAKCGLYA